MLAGNARPSTAEVWEWLADVPDPEIPVISITDLGIVRDIGWTGEALEVTLTPTYSGCPATSVIAMDVKKALRDRGVAQVTIRQQISPPWTTDWLTEAGRAKLEAYGIAPPSPSGGPERCPHCGSQAVARISQFGSTPCKALWRCGDCAEPFDYFKCH